MRSFFCCLKTGSDHFWISTINVVANSYEDNSQTAGDRKSFFKKNKNKKLGKDKKVEK